MLKRNGVNLAAVSYDAQEVLHRFAAANNISYPLLSDAGSVVIRQFGILNTNVPADVKRFYGIPFPGQYLIAPDGTVREKLFLPDYQTRSTASEVLLKDFHTGVGNNAGVVSAGDVAAKIVLSDARSFSGHRLGIAAEFEISPGCHIYGQPLPSNYIATTVVFDDEIVAEQMLNFPAPTPLRFEALGETLPVYTGKVRAVGHILLKQRLQPGAYKLAGTVQFQECNDKECKLPQRARFEIPLRVEAMVAAPPNK